MVLQNFQVYICIRFCFSINLLENLILTLIRFPQHQSAASGDIEDILLQVSVLSSEQTVLLFYGEKIPQLISRYINSPDAY